jgi:hypothetical protein
MWIVFIAVIQLISAIGLRHVPEEEDKVRWQASSVLTLHQLQDRVYIHSSGEEAKST